MQQVVAWLILVLMSGFPLWAAYHEPSLNDDTYITLTYAQSIAAGRGFVFNQPPATLGTTTPLLTFVVAGLSFVLQGMETSRIAVAFTALCWAGITWLVYAGREGLGLSDWEAISVSGIVIASGWVSFLGMEAYLFAFLLILTVVLYFRRTWLLAGIVVGLLFLTRGEGILLLPALLLYHLGERWKEKKSITGRIDNSVLKLVLGCSLIVAIWSTYAWITFGRVLPNTLSAKLAQRAAGHWESFPHRLLYEWMPSWGKQFALSFFPSLNLWWVLVIVGLGYVLLKRRQWLILLLWVSLYIAGYTALDVAAYWWYQLPILFVLQMLVALALILIQEYAATLSGKPRYLGYTISVGLVIAVMALLARPRMRAVLHGIDDPRASSYVALADWINENTEPSQSVAYVEIGYLGYHTDNRIIDLMGLVTPDITPHVAEDDFSSGFWAYEPDYFVYLPDFDWALADIRDDPRFKEFYKAVATLPGPRDTDFVIYARAKARG